MVLAHVRWSACFPGYCSVCVTIFVKQHVEHPLNRSHTEKSESSHLCITTSILTTKTHTLPSDLSKQHLQIYIRQSVTIFFSEYIYRCSLSVKFEFAAERIMCQPSTFHWGDPVSQWAGESCTEKSTINTGVRLARWRWLCFKESVSLEFGA